jgi:hypothetical protein
MSLPSWRNHLGIHDHHGPGLLFYRKGGKAGAAAGRVLCALCIWFSPTFPNNSVISLLYESTYIAKVVFSKTKQKYEKGTLHNEIRPPFYDFFSKFDCICVLNSV